MQPMKLHFPDSKLTIVIYPYLWTFSSNSLSSSLFSIKESANELIKQFTTKNKTNPLLESYETRDIAKICNHFSSYIGVWNDE